MNKLLPLFLIIICVISCWEELPPIDCLSCEEVDTDSLTLQDRRVLIEEFTGVRCVQCPQGSLEIQNLKSIHGERLIAVSIHAGSLSSPYNQSQYDFRTDEGEELLNFLGIPEGFPTGVINRKLFPGQSDIQLETAAIWAGHIATELDVDALVTLDIENDWDMDSRVLKVSISGSAIERIAEEIKLTVMITEDKIIDTQIVPVDGIIDDYEHNHVLRKTITAFDGDKIADSLNEGGFYTKEYTFTLPEAWKAEDCSVIAFIHLAGTNKLVLQANEKHLME